jgi:signal transduction histidine kinase
VKLALWPRSLKGQMLLAVALALMLAQGFSAALLYRAQAERRDAALIYAAAFRILSASARGPNPPVARPNLPPPRYDVGGRGFRLEWNTQSPLAAGDVRDGQAEAELRRILSDQAFDADAVVVFHRRIRDDSYALRQMARRERIVGHFPGPAPRKVLIAGVHRKLDGAWMVARVIVPPGEQALLLTLIGQTLLIYAVLVGAIFLILRRITRPLAALTGRLERFSQIRAPEGQLAPVGPDDVRRLIAAHNAMEDRILGLLDEKDVMLGAIGHDLKTPLAALRVRIESVENESERARMAATIEEIVRSLDDILSLARVGRPGDPLEKSELSALVASIVEEYEDLSEPVTLEASERITMPLRAIWLRRALRNLIDNALRYGKVARVSLARDHGAAVIRIEDDGPGIAEGEIGRMLEPFARGEPSRNSETGGAGLGLTLARAIAEQHGGALTLANRHDGGGLVAGLTVKLSLPLT